MIPNPNRFASAAAIASALVTAACSGTAGAAEVRWKKEKFVYTAQGKNIRDFMREFGASQGLTMVVAKEIEGTVNGRFDLLPESLMALMSANFGFVWYYDGNVLGIYPASDVRSEIVRLGNTSAERLRQALERLDIPDPRYPITYDVRQGTALVSGPSRYVDLVLQTARAISQNPGAGSEVRVFPLRYAWAGDFRYTQGGREQVVPGVATVLSRLYGGAPPVRVQVTRPRATLDKLRGLGLSLSPGDGARGRAPNPEPEALDPAPAVVSPDPDLPQFQADGRLNAVLVRDLPERMASHEAAVRALDIKPGVVEIEARIIEVNATEAENLGIDWRARGRRFDAQVGSSLPSLGWNSALADGAPALSVSGAPVPPGSGGVLTTVLGDAGRFLITRVSALAQEGKANLLASPKVLTLDNVEAVLEDLNTFFVRVQGNLDVDLFNVSAGTSLQVRPLIVTEGGRELVKLAIRIEDGAITGEAVDGVPVVRRSSISTQSIIADGEALLIAGYARESGSSGKSGVPGLSEVPVAGWLFKNTEQRRTKVERFFLLTPRISKS